MKKLKKIALALIILIYLDITVSFIIPEPPAVQTSCSDAAKAGPFGDESEIEIEPH